jgi:hypothetical protein
MRILKYGVDNDAVNAGGSVEILQRSKRQTHPWLLVTHGPHECTDVGESQPNAITCPVTAGLENDALLAFTPYWAGRGDNQSRAVHLRHMSPQGA